MSDVKYRCPNGTDPPPPNENNFDIGHPHSRSVPYLDVVKTERVGARDGGQVQALGTTLDTECTRHGVWYVVSNVHSPHVTRPLSRTDHL